MIHRVIVKHFKRFDEETFELSDHIVLAGPNNSGKTTLLQAIVVWNLALQKWNSKRGQKGKAKARTGVPITRKDFTALPLSEMNLLWHDTLTALRKEEMQGEQKAGWPRVMTITLEGKKDDVPWSLGFEFRYQSTEQIYVKPILEDEASIPKAVNEVLIVHVPPFSGIGAEETKYDRDYQNLLIGQGKPGDILRNLLLEIHQQGPENWSEFCKNIEDIFGFRLLPPEYHGQPFIVCKYLPGIPKSRGKNGLPDLDVSCAGSGFHQVLLLLGFLYARPASVLLLDEPDAHQHVILQKQMHDRLRRIVADRRCQLLIATHSEVLIDGTSPEQILSFYGAPHMLVASTEREQVREALKRLVAMDLLLAEGSNGILYVEGETDFNLLKAWAKALAHPLHKAWFENNPFWHGNQGCNPRESRAHFFALRAIKPNMRGYLLLDGDNRSMPNRELSADGFTIGRWTRYEAESYLIHPDVLRRFVEKYAQMPMLAHKAMEVLQDELPPAVLRNPLADHDYLNRTPASKTLLPRFFKEARIEIRKSDYYLVAEQMMRDEIPGEVAEKLDAMASMMGFQDH